MVIRVHPDNFDVENYRDTLQSVTLWMCKELELKVSSIDIIFVSDNKLKEMHKEYLHDDSYTDVMAFNLSENQSIEGEIYISYDRVKLQAKQYKVSILIEISRLLIHACLHLAGYDDKHHAEQFLMQQKENTYLNMVNRLFIN